ncbi:hypothetical protein J3459_017184 [Metarhizium acridum]|nr:hypothetical protein J3459_017184 [Metarhizium acridum]
MFTVKACRHPLIRFQLIMRCTSSTWKCFTQALPCSIITSPGIIVRPLYYNHFTSTIGISTIASNTATVNASITFTWLNIQRFPFTGCPAAFSPDIIGATFLAATYLL